MSLCWVTSNWFQLYELDIELDPDAVMIEPVSPKTPICTDETGSKDGPGAGDHDQPFCFGRRPTSRVPFPFTERQFARLLILRGKFQAASH